MPAAVNLINPPPVTEAARIDAAIRARSPRSPLVGKGAAFDSASRRYNLDWRLLVAIAGAETSFGTYGPSQPIHNPFGMGPGIRYASWESAINAAAANLRSNYLDHGLDTVGKIGAKWAPSRAANDPTGLNSNWSRNVTAYLTSMGGNPSVLTRDKQPGLTGAIGTRESPDTPIGDAISGAAGAITNPIGDVLGLLSKLFSLGTWLRVASVVGGAAAMILALVVVFRTQIAKGVR